MLRRILSVLPLLLVSSTAFAQDGDATANAIKVSCYFFAVAFAAIAGTTAQSKAAAAALEGIGRNPSAADKMFTPLLLSLALMESLVIFTLSTIFFT